VGRLMLIHLDSRRIIALDETCVMDWSIRFMQY